MTAQKEGDVPPRAKSDTGRPDPVDAHVGSRVRLRRTLLGMSQEKLGNAVGLTFQQIQKYERGLNRIGSSRLYQFCKVLDVPVSFFFDEMPGDMGTQPSLAGQVEQAVHDENMSRRETLELVRAYYKIDDRNTRKRVYELVKAIGARDAEADDQA
jgi:transcriptional regulator with XRE-family HTH domain